jgi:hypothetical protein
MNSGRRPLRNSFIPATRLASVQIVFHDGAVLHTGRRIVNLDVPQPLDGELAILAGHRRIPFIIRGSELRDFVDNVTPQVRYDLFARCLDAQQLTGLQARIRTLQTRLRQSTTNNQELRDIDADIAAITGGALTKWEVAAVLSWLASRLKEAGLPNAVTLDESDPALLQLRLSAANELSTVQRASLESARGSLAELLPGNGKRAIVQPVMLLRSAQAKLSNLTAATAQSESRAIIDEALALLSGHPEIDDCPVCETPFEVSPLGSRSRVIERLHQAQINLREISAALADLKSITFKFERQFEQVSNIIQIAAAAAGCDAAPLLEEWTRVHNSLSRNDDSGIAAFEKSLMAVDDALGVRIGLMAPDAPRVFGPLDENVRSLRALNDRASKLESRHQRARAMLDQVTRARRFIDEKAHAFFADAVAATSADAIRFYKNVQKHAKIPVDVKIQLVDVDNQDARGIEVLVDFPSLPDEKPRAVLSDSQIHTLALGMQIAFIRRFNANMPFIVLDDVVTSHDAPYRRRIAKAIIDEMGDLQLVVLTHDEQLYKLMQSRLAEIDQARWTTTRINMYDKHYGPSFTHTRTLESDIEYGLEHGDAVGNAIRQYVEE